MRILLVEDDKSIAQLLKEALITQHYLVDLAPDGQEGWELASAFKYDLILLDLMLPKLDGISFCRKLRAQGAHIPVLLLTGQDTSTNKVMGLDAGADDYMIKPFDLQELLARIRALLRRGSLTATPVLAWEALRLDPSSCEVTYDKKPLRLTAKEYALLELFLRNTQRIFSQSALLDHLWSFDEPPSENTVRAHIKSLRQKLKKAGAAADLIETVYGLGYRLKPENIENSKLAGLRPATLTSHCANKIQNLGTFGDHAGEFHNPAPSKLKTIIGETSDSKLSSGYQHLQNSGHFLLRRKPPEPSAPKFKTQNSIDGTSQTQQPIQIEISTIWERFKDGYGDRLLILEQAIRALAQGSLSDELRQQAYTQAHTLAGSLGSFGMLEASGLSREIEKRLQTQETLRQQDQEDLTGLVVALRQQLEQPTSHSEQVAMPATTLEQPTTVKQSRLLIVDDDAVASALVAEAQTWGLQAEMAGDLLTARKAIAQTRPDVVLLDLCFADSVETGFALLAELTTQQPPVPVLVLTAQEDFADRVKVARLGARGFLQKPVSPTQVMQAIAQILQQSSPPGANLLIVDDDPQLLEFLHTLLEPWGFRLTLLNDPQQFWTTLEQSPPDLLILDVEMPHLSGIDLCQVVRNDPRWSELPVLFLSAHNDAETVHRVFTVGADDYVNKPVVGPELVARVLNRLERTQILRKLQKNSR